MLIPAVVCSVLFTYVRVAIIFVLYNLVVVGVATSKQGNEESTYGSKAMDITKVAPPKPFSILTVGEYGMRVRDKFGRNLDREREREKQVK